VEVTFEWIVVVLVLLHVHTLDPTEDICELYTSPAIYNFQSEVCRSALGISVHLEHRLNYTETIPNVIRRISHLNYHVRTKKKDSI
jgi:hypothetical protein